MIYRAADEFPLSGLGQLGAVGVVLGILFWFAWQVYKRERDRADAADAEVARLNALILVDANRYAGAMERTADALSKSNELLLLYRDAPPPRRRP